MYSCSSRVASKVTVASSPTFNAVMASLMASLETVMLKDVSSWGASLASKVAGVTSSRAPNTKACNDRVKMRRRRAQTTTCAFLRMTIFSLFAI